jgi:hypothetical protein
VIWLAVVFALASAATTGLSTAVQHHSASTRTLRTLWRHPRWLLALALGPIGFTWHVLALHNGPISLVQPIVIVGIVAALPLRDALSRHRPQWRDVRTVTLTVAALAVFLLAADPRPAPDAPDLTGLFLAVATCAAVAGLAAALAGAVRRPVARASLLGVTSGILFGLMAVLVDATQLWLRDHAVAGLPLTWLPYAIVACGVGGLTVNQLAYNAGPLAASMPILNVVNCLLTVAFGVTVLGETVQMSPASLTVSAAALGLIGWGLWRLSGPGPLPRPRTSSTSSPEAPSAPERAASGY